MAQGTHIKGCRRNLRARWEGGHQKNKASTLTKQRLYESKEKESSSTGGYTYIIAPSLVFYGTPGCVNKWVSDSSILPWCCFPLLACFIPSFMFFMSYFAVLFVEKPVLF